MHKENILYKFQLDYISKQMFYLRLNTLNATISNGTILAKIITYLFKKKDVNAQMW